MWRENKPMLSDFIYEDQFELNSYLSYLFNQFYYDIPDQSEDKMIKQ
ncbi:hypothetical protein J2S09_000867 [Bacillus fengqiuensis]|nr:hypothetical protein [Bacillus fengqiuensis]